MRRPLALLLLGLLCPACRPPETPADRYRRFIEAARSGREGEAWALLSTRTRKALAERGKALSGEKLPRGIDLSGPELVLGDLAATAPRVKSVTVLRESAEAAVVGVEDEGGGKGEVTLVREGGDWRVDLPGG